MYYKEKVLNDLFEGNLEKSKMKNKVVQNNLPHLLDKLQCLFIESAAITLICIIEVKRNSGSRSSGLGNLAFCKYESMLLALQKKKLSNTKYLYSKKPILSKSIPQSYQVTELEISELKETIVKQDLKTINILFKKCLIKSFNKNYKSGSVERVWIEKKNSFDSRPLGIPTLRDRVLQKII
jgi:hypothetical protein